MAENNAPEEGAENDASKESKGLGKKKLILLVVLALLIVGASIGGTLAVLKLTGGGDAPAVEEEMVENPEQAAVEVKKKAIYYPLKPPIIVTFDAKGRQRYMQADVTLLTREQDVIAAIEMHMPMIRNALVLLIGSQLFEDIQTAEGKELLRLQCLQELQQLMEKEIGKPGIEQVFFENMVMQ